MSSCQCETPLLFDDIDLGVHCLRCGRDSADAIKDQLAVRRASIDQIDAQMDELIRNDPTLEADDPR